MRNLVKGYKGVPVLHDVSFSVARGTVFALLGANGSGKTTTINILTTLITADGGTASVAGFDVTEQPAEVRDRISLTGQFAAVDHVLTARENLILIGELTTSAVSTRSWSSPPPAVADGRHVHHLKDVASSGPGSPRSSRRSTTSASRSSTTTTTTTRPAMCAH